MLFCGTKLGLYRYAIGEPLEERGVTLLKPEMSLFDGCRANEFDCAMHGGACMTTGSPSAWRALSSLSLLFKLGGGGGVGGGG